MTIYKDCKSTVKLLLLYVTVGVIAGLGAIAFQQMLSMLNILFMEGIVGFNEIKVVTGAQRFTLPWEMPQLRLWLFPVITGLGGLMTGLIVYGFAPEAAGHGTDEVIDSYHRHDGAMRLRVSIVKMIASAITLGTGGSGGKEGPIAQIGAGFGSFICTHIPGLKQYRREVMLAGMAAGIAAIFRAPLAGAIFAAEILHSDMEYDGKVLIPAALASVVSYGVYALYFGCAPVYVIPAFNYEFALKHLLPFTVIGILSAGFAIIFVKVFYFIRDFFKKLNIPAFLKPTIGGIITGLICMKFPSALGEGSFHMQRIIDGDKAFGILAALVLIKMLTTGFSIGSGGSGGIFGPSLFIGAALGGVFANSYMRIVPETQIAPIVFVLVGMVAFFAGAANSPISTVIIVAEMTATYTLLVPFLWVSCFGYIFSQRWNIYENQKTLSQGILETDGTDPRQISTDK